MVQLSNYRFNGDLTFFTNQGEDTLKDRFVRVLNSNTKYFDVLVGYFRTSGFHELYKNIEEVEKTRILVGLNVDRATFEYIEEANNIIRNIVSSEESINNYSEALVNEINNSEDTRDLNESVKAFIQMLVSKKIEMRIYPHAPLHAKVYILRKDMEKVPDSFGSVITGSSNFSKSGLINNLEFNVELKDSRDVVFALERFEDLWQQGVDISEAYIETVQNKTWLNENNFSAKELFYKVLADYFEAELNDEEAIYYIPSGFKMLKYQEDAIKRAKEILQAYNGVFISDVVGLGKTYICAMLAQIVEPGKKLILCPPVLVEYWKQVFLEFNVSATVESIGKLDQILETNYHQYKYVFVDEAHRFRNQNTESYQKLHQICFQKKVILITATPQNNKIEDLANLIYLFQAKNNSNIIPDTKNIEKYFNHLRKMKNEYENQGDAEGLLNISKEIQDKVLRNIMIRRTRGEIQTYYRDDLETQGLTFPKVSVPIKLTYLLDSELDTVFNQTIELIKKLKYARYKPLIYLNEHDSLNLNNIASGQNNLAGFMKALLVKRLESSFFAFKKTLDRFVDSYEYAINMLKDNAFYIGDKINVYDLISKEREEEIINLLDQDRLSVHEAKSFSKEFEIDLLSDLAILKTIKGLWSEISNDPKMETLIERLNMYVNTFNKKIIIFSESAETVEYLQRNLTMANFRCISFTGNDSITTKKVIELNFNPNIDMERMKDDYDILITSDVLSEGINLHRSNVIINYDLPWNPTKIMQRVGRINRVGTEHSEISICNFFPTDQSHAHLSLEENILNKIQAFHDLLGEDNKYLTEDENVSSHRIFTTNLLKTIDDIVNEDSNVGNSDLNYLKIIREVKEVQPKLFSKITSMPYKIRCCVKSEEESVLTYLRKGSLKKFFYSNSTGVIELSFQEAARVYEEASNEKKQNLSENYYQLLKDNKNAFEKVLEENRRILNQGQVRNPNDLKMLGILKSLARLHPEEKSKLTKYIQIWNDGVIPKKLTNNILKFILKEKNISKVIKEIDQLIPDIYLDYEQTKSFNATLGNSQVVVSLNRKPV